MVCITSKIPKYVGIKNIGNFFHSRISVQFPATLFSQNMIANNWRSTSKLAAETSEIYQKSMFKHFFALFAKTSFFLISLEQRQNGGTLKIILTCKRPNSNLYTKHRHSPQCKNSPSIEDSVLNALRILTALRACKFTVNLSSSPINS